MSGIAHLVAWCKREREQQQGQLEWMESGRMQVGTRDAGGRLTDTTPEAIAEAKRKIDELDRLIARHPEVK